MVDTISPFSSASAMSWALCQKSYRFSRGVLLQRGAQPEHNVPHHPPDSQQGKDRPDTGTQSHSSEGAMTGEEFLSAGVLL